MKTDNDNLLNNSEKTREQLIAELEVLRKQCAQSGMNTRWETYTHTTPAESAFYKTILEKIPIGIWTADKHDVIFYANPCMGDIAGMPCEQMRGRSVLKDCSERTHEFFIPCYLKAKETLEAVSFGNVQVISPDGRLSYQSGWLFPHSHNGEYDGMIGIVEDVTERRLMEYALMESEANARSFLESSQDSICNLTIDGGYMSMNPAGRLLHDIGPDDNIIGVHCTESIVENRGEVEDAIKKASQGERVTIEYKTVSRKGSEIWWNAQFTPVIDLDGTIKSILLVSRDVSSYKRLERNLLKAQEILIHDHSRLTALFKEVERAKQEWENTMDCVDDMVILTGPDGQIKRFNRSFSQFTNRSHDELIGLGWERIMHENGLESVSLHAGRIELYHLPSDRWFELTSYPFQDSALELAGTVITLHETTEIKHMTDELNQTNKTIEKNRENLQNALDEVSGLIQNVTSNMDTRIRLSNPHLKICHEAKHCTKQDCPCFGKEAMRCWQVAGTFCGGKAQGAFVQKYEDCSECCIYKAATSDPIYMIGEQFNNMMHVLDMRNMELEKAYEELKATQTQMLQREKMASIGQLAAGVAHEINNPMGFIISNLGTLEKYSQKLKEYINAQSRTLRLMEFPDTSHALEEIRNKLKLDYVLNDITPLIEESLNGAARVTRIVQNLKSFSRVDHAEYTAADINECIESTLNIVWNELKYKSTVEKEYGELPLTKCYPQQLNQVFMNLLVNAAQAIEKEGIIKIKTWSADGAIHISISDTGAGIPEEKINKIFDPFYTTKEVGKGTGLGLSISYDIVKKHNGEIHVRSEIGTGTEFLIHIPVVKETRHE